MATLDELQAQYTALLQQQAGLSPEQSQQVAQISLKFAQDHSSDLIGLAGPEAVKASPLGGLFGR
jgi:hypothetical protein